MLAPSANDRVVTQGKEVVYTKPNITFRYAAVRLALFGLVALVISIRPRSEVVGEAKSWGIVVFAKHGFLCGHPAFQARFHHAAPQRTRVNVDAGVFRQALRCFEMVVQNNSNYKLVAARGRRLCGRCIS